MMGYHTPREFYVPKNSNFEKQIHQTTMPTIFWKPDVTTVLAKSFSIDFINKSKCKNMRVIVEGIAKDGKSIFIEKVVNVL